MKSLAPVIPLKTKWHNAAWSASAACLEDLVEAFRCRAIDDVTKALEASILEFIIQRHILGPERKSIFSPPAKISDFTFPYLETLQDLRDTEARTGQRGLLSIESAGFDKLPFAYAARGEFISHADNFMTARHAQARSFKGKLQSLRMQFLSSPAFEPAEQAETHNTQEILAVLRHNWLEKSVQPRLSVFSSQAGLSDTYIGELADRMVLNSFDAARVIRNQAAAFVQGLPFMRDPRMVLRRINQRRKVQYDSGDLHKYGPENLSYLMIEYS